MRQLCAQPTTSQLKEKLLKHQARNSEFHLRPPELARLIRHAQDPRDRLILELFVYTGIRRAELRMIRKGDVDCARCRLLVRRGKGGKQRIVYLPDGLAKELCLHSEVHIYDYLFSGRGGGPMSLRNINYIVARVARRARVETPNPRYKNVAPHLLRHSLARNWKRAGGSLESLQKILGHTSLKTTMDAYGTESQSETEENYRNLISTLVQA